MNRQTINRREAIKQALMSYVGATVGGSLLSACIPSGTPRPPTCPIGWQPNALKPVFYGVRDYGAADGAPGPCRVFFPSLDGTVFDAPILEGCGRYPLILFSHGDCNETEHYKKWEHLPVQLARSGYVVVVPEVPGLSIDSTYAHHPALPRMAQIVAWMREGWVHRNMLLPTTGVAGHSRGALLGARFAATNSVSAYASIGGVWRDWSQTVQRPITRLSIPMFFCWGTLDPNADLGTSLWDSLAVPKHRALFLDGGHWDYLRPSATSCGSSALRGDCTLTSILTADLVTMFFAKYLPLEDVPNLSTWHLFDLIPASLIPPPLLLSTDAQRSFASGHLNGFSRLGSSNPDCRVTLTWDTHFGSGTSK